MEKMTNKETNKLMSIRRNEEMKKKNEEEEEEEEEINEIHTLEYDEIHQMNE